MKRTRPSTTRLLPGLALAALVAACAGEAPRGGAAGPEAGMAAAPRPPAPAEQAPAAQPGAVLADRDLIRALAAIEDELEQMRRCICRGTG